MSQSLATIVATEPRGTVAYTMSPNPLSPVPLWRQRVGDLYHGPGGDARSLRRSLQRSVVCRAIVHMPILYVVMGGHGNAGCDVSLGGDSDPCWQKPAVARKGRVKGQREHDPTAQTPRPRLGVVALSLSLSLSHTLAPPAPPVAARSCLRAPVTSRAVSLARSLPKTAGWPPLASVVAVCTQLFCTTPVHAGGRA